MLLTPSPGTFLVIYLLLSLEGRLMKTETLNVLFSALTPMPGMLEALRIW